MNLKNRLLRRLRILFRRDDVETDLSDEVRLHLDLETRELMREGRTAHDAHREARIRLGGIEQTKEAARDVRPLQWLDGIGLDVKLGLRMLRKSWGLTLIGGFAMAIAIGIGTTTFAIIDAYSGSTLPLPEGDRVVRLMVTRGSENATAIADFEWWGEQLQSVENIAAFRIIDRVITGGTGSEVSLSVAQMTSAGFRAARVQPLAGRTFSEEDERPGAPPVAVIGQKLWMSHFAGDQTAIGKTIQLGGVNYVVIGIMPDSFRLPINHQVWVPLHTDELREKAADLIVLGRVKADATIEKARAEIRLKGPAPTAAQADPATRARILPYAQSLSPEIGFWSTISWALALLLVPPCTNIAILIYARNISRQDEFAARFVLGAGRTRIVAQLLVEALILSGMAAGVGLLLAQQFLAIFYRFAEQDPTEPFWVNPALSLQTILFIASATTFAALLAGGIPALRAMGGKRQAGLQNLGARSSPRLGITWTALVVLQVALCTALIPRASELIWTFLNPLLEGRTFAAEDYITARLSVEANDPGAPALPRELTRHLKDRLGISGATLSAFIDGIDERIADVEINIPGREPLGTGSNRVDSEYFDVYSGALIAGRKFETADFLPGHPVVIVDRLFAEQLPGGNALGARIRYIRRSRDTAQEEPWYEIIGIVDPVSPSTQRPFIYHPRLRDETGQMVLTLRVGPSIPPTFTQRLVEDIASFDPKIQVERVRTLKDLYDSERNEETTFGLVFATMLAVVLLFSGAGIHTLVVFAVVLRRREIGIRSALGAPPLRLVADVFRKDLSPVIAGAIAGALLALPVDKLIQRDDGLTIPIAYVAGGFACMLAIGLLAIAGPARRALRVDSVEALRAE